MCLLFFFLFAMCGEHCRCRCRRTARHILQIRRLEFLPRIYGGLTHSIKMYIERHATHTYEMFEYLGPVSLGGISLFFFVRLSMPKFHFFCVCSFHKAAKKSIGCTVLAKKGKEVRRINRQTFFFLLCGVSVCYFGAGREFNELPVLICLLFGVQGYSNLSHTIGRSFFIILSRCELFFFLSLIAAVCVHKYRHSRIYK